MNQWDPHVPAEHHDKEDAPRGPPRPKTWEAHRRHRQFDERGVLESETHEAVRVRFREDRKSGRLLPGRELRDPSVPVGILISAALHGAVWWLGMSTIAFAPSPWWVLAWIPLVGLTLGWKFVLFQTFFVLPVAGVFIAFDGFSALAIILPIAGLFAPGRWIQGEW